MSRAVATDELSFWRTKRWWLRAGQTSAGLYVASALGFVSTLVAARVLGASGFGALELAVVAVTSVATLLDFSLEEAVMHHGARALARGDGAALRRLIRTSLGIDLAIGVAVLAVLTVAAPLVVDVVSDGDLAVALIRLAALEAFVVTLNGTTGALLIVCGRAHLRAWSSAVANAARLVAVLFAAAGGADPTGMLTGFVVGSAIGAAVQAFLAWNTGRSTWHDSREGDVRAHEASAARLVTFGMHSSVTTTLVAVRYAAAFVLLGRTLGPGAVGVLAVALFPVTLADVASSPLRLLMIPEQATLAARGRPDVMWNGLVAYAKGSLAIGVTAAAIGWLLLPNLVPLLYGESYDAAIRPARILLVAAVTALVVAWSKALPAALGRPGVRTAMSAAELVVTIAALAIVAGGGVNGVAAALSVVSVVTACAWWIVARSILAPASAPAMGDAG
jgi:O-antigen/teichoic acid export membrane protein